MKNILFIVMAAACCITTQAQIQPWAAGGGATESNVVAAIVRGGTNCSITPQDTNNNVSDVYVLDGDSLLTYKYELTTNGVTMLSSSNIDHKCGVVTSNYYGNFIWRGKTNRVDLESTKLRLLEPPQWDVTNLPPNGNMHQFNQFFMVTNGIVTNLIWTFPSITNIQWHGWDVDAVKTY